MRVVVVYESMFGNTKTIAEAIANGLGEAGEVALGTVDELSPEMVGDAGLLVAGGPTHAHGMARPNAHQTIARAPRGRGGGHRQLRCRPGRLPAAPAGGRDRGRPARSAHASAAGQVRPD